MTPREIVRNQIRHQETKPVPYTLAFEPEVKERLDQHYGGQAVIGFGGGREHQLGDITLLVENQFANVYVNSLDKVKPIASAEALLITAVARMASAGSVIEEFGDRPLDAPKQKSGAPLLIEPVHATITLKGNRPFKVYALDHAGRKPARPVEVPVRNGQFTLDGSKYRTLYYVVEFSR